MTWSTDELAKQLIDHLGQFEGPQLARIRLYDVLLHGAHHFALVHDVLHEMARDFAEYKHIIADKFESPAFFEELKVRLARRSSSKSASSKDDEELIDLVSTGLDDLVREIIKTIRFQEAVLINYVRDHYDEFEERLSSEIALPVRMEAEDEERLVEGLASLVKQYGEQAVRAAFVKHYPEPERPYTTGLRLPNIQEAEEILAHAAQHRWKQRDKRTRVLQSAKEYYDEIYAKWIKKGIAIPSVLMRQADIDLYQRLYAELGSSAFAMSGRRSKTPRPS